MSQYAYYMQAAVLLQFEPRLKNSGAIGNRGETKRPDALDTPQSTGLADVWTLARSFDAIALAAVSSLHDSMPSFELSVAEISTSLLMTRGQIVDSTTSGSGR